MNVAPGLGHTSLISGLISGLISALIPALLVLVLALALVLAPAPVLAGPEQRPITHEDLWLMPRVGTPVISPDGRHAVAAVSRPAYEDEKQESHLWLIATDGSAEPRQITFGAASESHVSWSPDSRRIAFSAQRDGDDAAQVYILDLAEGGEARRVTEIVTGARRPVFSPDGSRIAFTSDVPPGTATEEERRQAVEEEEERDYNVLTYTGFPIRNWNTWLTDRQPRLFVQEFGSGSDIPEPDDLLAGSELAGLPGYDGARTAGGSELKPVWTPDGQALVFVASANRDRFAFDYTNNDLWQVSSSGGEPRRLTGSDDPQSDHNWDNPAFGPDGATLYAHRVPRTEHVYNAARLAILDWPSGEPRDEIHLPEYRSVMDFAIAPDGQRVFMLAEDAGLIRLYEGSSLGGEGRLAFDHELGIYTGLGGAGDADQPVLIAAWESAANPAEVVRIDPDGGGHKVLTAFAANRAEALDLPPVEHFWFESDQGRQIHSLLVRPAGFDPDRRYPLFVMMHGGPHIMYRDYFFLRWNYHLLAGTDFVLVLTNYKGSTGFGEDFARAIQGDPLRGPAEEINQAADVAIERYDFINGERQCAGGASYGGHLANWMQSSTDRYRCLVSHAGLVNLKTQWGTSDAVYHREANVGGPPWEIPEAWADQNPILYAERWQTPVLVTIGKKDERVPLANAKEYWTALQRQQIESRLLVYPEQDHWIMRGPESRHFYGEVEAWLKRWLLEED